MGSAITNPSNHRLPISWLPISSIRVQAMFTDSFPVTIYSIFRDHCSLIFFLSSFICKIFHYTWRTMLAKCQFELQAIFIYHLTAHYFPFKALTLLTD